MKLLYKTTDRAKADEFQKKACQKYNAIAIYRFQYKAKDGNFYYEILLNENWL